MNIRLEPENKNGRGTNFSNFLIEIFLNYQNHSWNALGAGIKLASSLGFIYHVFLLISKFTNGLCLHHFLGTKATEANKSLKTDANGAHYEQKD